MLVLKQGYDLLKNSYLKQKFSAIYRRPENHLQEDPGKLMQQQMKMYLGERRLNSG
jgi:hypothetical protein